MIPSVSLYLALVICLFLDPICLTVWQFVSSEAFQEEAFPLSYLVACIVPRLFISR